MPVGEDWAGRGQRGASLVEYLLLLVLIAMLCAAAVQTLGVKPTNVLGTAYERGSSTFVVTCRGGGSCTFIAGQDARTAKNTTYHWSWGDGTTDVGPRFDHFFAGDDDHYRVELTSTNNISGETIREHVDCTRQEYTLIVTCDGAG